MLRPAWPAMKSLTWVAMCHDNLFLQHLYQNSSWSKAGFGWRTHFFIRGQLYRDKSTGQVFRALNANHRMCAMWPMSQLSSLKPVHADEYYGFGNFEATPSRASSITASCWLPDVSSKTKPLYAAMLDWDDWEAATCEAICPLGLVARGCPWNSLPKCICSFQTSDFQHPLAVAACKSFVGCSKDDLLKLARESKIRVVGFCPLLPCSIDMQSDCMSIIFIDLSFVVMIITQRPDTEARLGSAHDNIDQETYAWSGRRPSCCNSGGSIANPR